MNKSATYMRTGGKILYAFAFKVWHDERYYICKSSTADNIAWTKDISSAYKFDKIAWSRQLKALGMDLSIYNTYDRLHISKELY